MRHRTWEGLSVMLAALLVQQCNTGSAERGLSSEDNSSRFPTPHAATIAPSRPVSVAPDPAWSDGGAAARRINVLLERVTHVTTTTTVTSNVTATTTVSPLSKGYTYSNGLGWYKIYAAAVTFDDAMTRCQTDNADVIIFNSQSEVDLMVAMMKGAKVTRGWVGLTDRVTEGAWITPGQFGDSISTTFETWISGEPRNTADLDCVNMDANAPGMLVTSCTTSPVATVCEI